MALSDPGSLGPVFAIASAAALEDLEPGLLAPLGLGGQGRRLLVRGEPRLLDATSALLLRQATKNPSVTKATSPTEPSTATSLDSEAPCSSKE